MCGQRGKEFGGFVAPFGRNSCAFSEMGKTIFLVTYSVIVPAKRILQRASGGLTPLFLPRSMHPS